MTDQNIATNQIEKEAEEKLSDLLRETEKINQGLKHSGEDTEDKLNEIDANVNKSVEKVEKISAELDEIEKETEDELDQLILEQAEDLASEE